MHPQQYLTYRQLSDRYGKSRVQLWRWVRDGHFPAPVQLGPKSVAFHLQDILEWEAGLRHKTYQRPEAPAHDR